MAWYDNLSPWARAESRHAGKPVHPVNYERPKSCRQCGYHFLFWRKHEGRWRLHHYADLADGNGPHFVPHRCGFDSAGTPKEAPHA